MNSPKMMKVIGYAFLCMMLSSTGCGPGSPTVFTSPDGRVSITAPAGWGKYTFQSKLGKIGISNTFQHGWGEVIIENKSDLKDGLTLSDYAGLVLKKAATNMASEDRSVSEPTSVTINGCPGMRYEIRATVQNTKFVYARTFIETHDFFVQVMLWTIPSYLEKNQPDFDSITMSLKQIK